VRNLKGFSAALEMTLQPHGLWKEPAECGKVEGEIFGRLFLSTGMAGSTSLLLPGCVGQT